MRDDAALTPEEQYERAVLALASLRLLRRERERADAALTPEAARQLAQAADRLRDRQLRRALRALPGRSSPRRLAVRALRAAAIVILLGNFAFTVAAAASQSLRAKVLQLLLTTTPSYTEVRYRVADEVALPDGWAEDYFPTYIPAGYSLREDFSLKGASFLDYVDENHHQITISFVGAYSKMRVDSEGAAIGTIILHGTEATTIRHTDGRAYIILPLGEVTVVVQTNDGYDTTLAVADGIRLIEKNKRQHLIYQTISVSSSKTKPTELKSFLSACFLPFFRYFS